MRRRLRPRRATSPRAECLTVITRRALGVCLVLGACLVAGARTLGAQTVAATIFLPVGHWSVDAARKLDAADRDVRFDGGARTPSLGDVVLVLERAASRPATDPLGALGRAYLARLREEFRESLGATTVSATLAAGVGRETGQLAPGAGLTTSIFPPPRRIAGADGLAGRATLAARAGRRLALRVEVGGSPDRVAVDRAQAVLAVGALGIWAGRRAPAYGPSSLGGVTIGGGAAFDGAGLFILRGSRIPGVLRHLGPWHAEVWASRLDSNYTQRHPYFAGGRLSIAPLRVLQLGWNRGTIFGGDDNERVTVQRLLDLAFIGFRKGRPGFEDQVMSFDARLTPTVGGVPVVGHLEWGTEDAAGAIRDVPGIVAGVELPVVPGAPWLAVGAERSSFAHSCCRNPPWGRHAIFRDGWTEGGALIGHPLGGEGAQTAVVARAELADARVRLRATAFRRVRGEENLFAPNWQGRSHGGSARAIVRLGARAEVQAAAAVERGDALALRPARPAWRADALSATVRAWF